MSVREKLQQVLDRMDEARLAKLLEQIESETNLFRDPQLNLMDKLRLIRIDAPPDFSSRAGLCPPEEPTVAPPVS